MLSKLGALFGAADKALDIAKEAVVDKDKQNELINAIHQIKEESYQIELQTKTIPWVDALHKMGRQILSLLSMIMPLVAIKIAPDVDPMVIMAMVAPNGVYNYVKGKGK